ncbi:MAG: hypothetical protein V5A64_06500 [Candidatus Thermoplasmatota archaeon]
MKKKNILMSLSLFTLVLIGLVQSVAAKPIGDEYQMFGLPIGWGLIIVAVIVGFLAYAFKAPASMAKPLGSILVVLVIAGLVLSFVSIPTETTPTATGTITPDVDWDVSTNSAGTDNSYNDDENTFTGMIYINKSAGTLYDDDNDSVYSEPVFNWSVSPSQSIGLSEGTQMATAVCRVLNPDKTFYEDSETRYLFEEASSGERDLTWTTDGTTSEESDYVTVDLGSTEYVQLDVEFNDDAVKYLDAGDSVSFQVEVCGQVYTATLTVIDTWGSC